jgi:hypothetical protein
MSVSTDSTADVFARFDAALLVFKEARKEFASLLKTRKTRAKKEEGAEPSAPKSAWTAWTSLVTTKYAAAYAEHMAAGPVNKKGALLKADLMGFAKKCRDKLFVEDWKEHESLWDDEHPKEAPKAKAPKAAAKADEPEAKPEPEPEPESKAKPEAKPEPKAKAEPKGKPKAKAKPEPDAEAAATAVQWKNKGKVYMKNEADQVWQMGADGVGEYVGFYDGKAIQKGKLSADE